ncbi:type 1 glutamine amidotransferase domain-containing protein [Actinomycetospora termitidis]|uniref:Type 1 glutamine amidotransferase domain-containing protein n=1 Tax=Actinomycetospora termitidis TaxID=3053470 RepID=A0ABT7MAM8_9PSEU|nr:type 1 glutamine amidotransferase domain-containing protein [Actinomycetospora sp. Odt1-22]MDL5157720.1 type 1 glutamine amidotransferase domain-containing protein [Actinomycetospora sp. Odt1-22]
MANELSGKRIAILAASGVEQVELEQPRKAAEDAGATTTLVSVDTGEIQAMNSDINPGDTFPVDRAIGDVSADDFDALILPGGTCNPDTLRQNGDVISFVQAIAGAGKPIAAICHAPWTLVEADLVRGKRLTSFPSLRTDIRNAGGTVVDEQVVVDQGLITSRNPHDLDAFCATLVKEFA